MAHRGPQGDRCGYDAQHLRGRIVGALGGRAAEDVVAAGIDRPDVFMAPAAAALAPTARAVGAARTSVRWTAVSDHVEGQTRVMSDEGWT